MAHPRTLEEWEALTGDEALTEAEKYLIKCCREGKVCILGNGERPETPILERNIRAELLRWLILGGADDCPIHEQGVWLAGAYVSGMLNLDYAVARGMTAIVNSTFENPFEARHTTFRALALIGSKLPALQLGDSHIHGDLKLTHDFRAEGEVIFNGAKIHGQLACSGGHFSNVDGHALNAQSAEIGGGAFLNNGFKAEGEVRLSSAIINGQLLCRGGHFCNPDEGALNAQGAEIGKDVFLDDRFKAEGEVCFSGARIGGQLACSGGHFSNVDGYALNAQDAQIGGGAFLNNGFKAEGKVSFSGAKINGQMSCRSGHFSNTNGDALNAGHMEVSESFLWRSVTISDGNVDLISTKVGDLVDDLDSWPEGERVHLDGFTYQRLSGSGGPVAARTRLLWLSRCDTWKGTFFPQPYMQLAKVLRDMGHDRDARLVLMEQQRRLRRHARTDLRITPNGDINVGLKSVWRDFLCVFLWIWDVVLRVTTGYGHAPLRSIFAMIVLVIVTIPLANRTWEEGSFAPNSDVLLVSSDWTTLANDPDVANPALIWSADGNAGQDWETFNRYAYAFDVVVPVLSLGQTDAWAPSTTRGDWGRVLWWARWVLSALGWVVSALGAAAITGIIRRD